MIPHKNIRIKYEAACVFVCFQSFKIPSAIGIVKEDILFLITPDDDMVKSSFKLYARFPCHPASLYSTICINASLTLCLSASWLNVAEIELSALSKQCLDRRIADMQTLAVQVGSWTRRRNRLKVTICWNFTNNDARKKLNRFYETTKN